MLLTWLSVELILALNCVVIVPGLMDSRWYPWASPKSSFASTTRCIHPC
jgi:hypothetical protein